MHIAMQAHMHPTSMHNIMLQNSLHFSPFMTRLSPGAKPNAPKIEFYVTENNDSDTTKEMTKPFRQQRSCDETLWKVVKERTHHLVLLVLSSEFWVHYWSSKPSSVYWKHWPYSVVLIESIIIIIFVNYY